MQYGVAFRAGVGMDSSAPAHEDRNAGINGGIKQA